MFCVTITFKLEGHKTTVIFFYYYFYYSVVYIDFSLHVNQDRKWIPVGKLAAIAVK